MHGTENIKEAVRTEGAVRRRRIKGDGHGSWINDDFKEGGRVLFGDEEDVEGETDIIDTVSQIRTAIRRR
jgi:hypothetical protein